MFSGFGFFFFFALNCLLWVQLKSKLRKVINILVISVPNAHGIYHEVLETSLFSSSIWFYLVI